MSDTEEPTTTSSSADLALLFESAGDNCEFGFVQNKFGVDPGGLLRWAVTPFRGLLGLLDNDLREIESLDDLLPLTDDMVRNTRYGIYFHSVLRSSEADGVRSFIADPEERARLYSDERGKRVYLAGKFRERLACEDVIFVMKQDQAFADVDIDDGERCFSKHGCAKLLFVSKDEGRPASVSKVSSTSASAQIPRLAPYYAAADVDLESWTHIMEQAASLLL